MNPAQLSQNATCIDRELTWFNTFLEHRIKLYFEGEPPPDNLLALIPPPKLSQTDAPYATIVHHLQLQPSERLVLCLCLIPHLKPYLLDTFFIHNQNLDRGYTEFGGLTGNSHSGFLPTCETAIFLLAGDNLSARIRYDSIFQPKHILFTLGILTLDYQHFNEPPLSAAINLSPEYRQLLITGKPYTPSFSNEFPAQEITTALVWDDLVLDPATRQEIDHILTWIQNKDLLMEHWQLKQRVKPGYRSLFYGPPGTGKTLTACLLGKKAGLPVFRVELSKVLSKYIGETEKNLAMLFDQAQYHDWILFFDEADSLFGKRIESQTSNDRAANQQVSYLLQRIEDYSGLVILATNLQSHLDNAFARRFQSMIRFPKPNAEQRLRLWLDTFMNKPFQVAKDVDFKGLANEHELTGGNIINILHYACIKAVSRKPQKVCKDDVLNGIQRELQKEGNLSRRARNTFRDSLPTITKGNSHRPVEQPLWFDSYGK
ncbi:ATPase, AAA family protein [Synechococcus sp. PCC 7335]|uniref:ATP-binding protein n=1 Tax=Synechococcus sp. (strain ATCC 29403 / PCC 7335) TaxID=91464 RepID=UPI00017ED66F|nr:ATP-binding protein [Synechococcus sp. PCC 7335]EDX83502.1 ATPase, AAA family protein [Synechococcus sp. PCC 7335]